MQNVLLKKLGVKYPIVQAPMAGGATTPELVATVANYGALGSFAAGYLSAEKIKNNIENIRALTSSPFAINLFIPQPCQYDANKFAKMKEILKSISRKYHLDFSIPEKLPTENFIEQIEIVYQLNVPILSFTFGCLDTFWIEKFKSQGTILIGTATHLAEAKILAERGIDIIVAQGSEAGGHRGTFIGKPEDNLISLRDLIPEFLHHVNTPIIASGGIMNASHIKDFLSHGVSAVQLGTVFLSCAESGIHPKYKQVLTDTDRDQTRFTNAFTGKLARGISNHFMQEMDNYPDAILDYPLQNTLTKPLREAASKVNNFEFMSLWAGQHVAYCKKMSVKALLDELTEGL